MNSGQMLLTLCAMFLLSTVILRVNKIFFSTNDVMLSTKLNVAAVSLASSIVEEASGRSFDEVTSDTTITLSSTSQLTTSADLGIDASEVYPQYDDFDDYNGYIDDILIDNTATYTIKCKVNYVIFDPASAAADKIRDVNYTTWYKKLQVSVTSISMKKPNGIQDTLQFSTVYSYWN